MLAISRVLCMLQDLVLNKLPWDIAFVVADKLNAVCYAKGSGRGWTEDVKDAALFVCSQLSKDVDSSDRF